LNKRNKIFVPSRFFPGQSYGRFLTGVGELVYDDSIFFANPKDFMLVLFTGGEDVDPSLYDDTSPKGYCMSNLERDIYERRVFNVAESHGVKFFGICRGMQFLNVILGGKMMHHIDSHAGADHTISLATREMPDTFVGNSLHHQMCIPSLHTSIIGWSTVRRSKIYIGDKDELMDYHGPEVEAIYNAVFKVLGVQWHPEMLAPVHVAHKIAFEMAKDFISMETGGFTKKYVPNYNGTFIKINRGIA
jgi:gamma-glutamyl-gamma-aminobutyrate hydrolase PuuD